MADRTVHIVDTGVANIASLQAAFRRLDAETQLPTDPDALAEAAYAVLPGVGAFGAGMGTLRDADLVGPLRTRLDDLRPVLAICLGMQLLAPSSEETPDVEGLETVEVAVERFPDDVRVPQFGWNEVRADSDGGLLETGYAYFANSYCLPDAPDGWTCARSEYGGDFISAMEHGPVLACQFHPELSGRWGSNLLRRWLERGDDQC